MCGTTGQIQTEAHSGSIAAAGQPITWTLAETAEQGGTCFEAMLLAIAAHDLRLPLQVLRSVHERLGVGVRTNSELGLLQRAENAVDRLGEQLKQLVSALLLYEQSNVLRLSPICLDPLLWQACRDHEEIAAKNGISIRVVPTRISIVSNTLLFGTIITNLVSNAVKYTQPGGRVLLGCRRFGQSVRIDVLDTGDGIADNGIPRPFETFSRLDFSHSGGLGIGLLIVRQAVKILKHRMEVSSAAGRGSRFSVVAMRA
jgi:two-component system, OmpR family, phosphate regulon sensor histidine kinase PhoR